MNKLIVARFAPTVLLAISALFAVPAVQAQPVGKSLMWAFPVPDPPPAASASTAPQKKLPGSAKSYTQAQIDDQFNPPDWYPNEHGPLPTVVAKGVQAQACGSCHLMSGQGHPESAQLAGLPLDYMLRQMADFKDGLRKDAKDYEPSLRAARMNIIAAGLPDEDMRKALEFFAAMKPAVWYKVVEAKEVPKTVVNGGRMRLPAPGGGSEALGNRIITLPQDPERVESRDPHSGFIAYVPVGSLKKGEALVTKAGSKTIQCAICHGEGLKGLGDVPRIAGVHPIYVVRQLFDFQTGSNSSSAGALMKNVVKDLTEDDMIAIAAYTASLAP
jgi:cytochrome c553